MKDKDNRFNETIMEFVAQLQEAHEADTKRKRKGGKLKRSFDECARSHGWPKAMQSLFDDEPILGYLAAAWLCGENQRTADEDAAIAKSNEVRREPILDNGEPAQTELFVHSPVRFTRCDIDGAYFKYEVRRMADTALYLAQRERTSLYLRYQPNAVVCGLKGEGKNARRAQYGGRLYISDKKAHEGTLLATAWFEKHCSYLEWCTPRFEA